LNPGELVAIRRHRQIAGHVEIDIVLDIKGIVEKAAQDLGSIAIKQVNKVIT
jgi:hypothetical protein